MISRPVVKPVRPAANDGSERNVGECKLAVSSMPVACELSNSRGQARKKRVERLRRFVLAARLKDDLGAQLNVAITVI